MLQERSDVRYRHHDHADVEYVIPGSVTDDTLLMSPPMDPAAQKARLLDGTQGANAASSTTAAATTAPAAAKAPPSNGASKILFLDGLRGLAAMMVIVQHVGYLGVSMGQPAVDTFFVLSAFLLTMIFERKARGLIEQHASPRRWGWALLDYFARRFLRVYPLFAAVAIYLTVYSPEQKHKLFFIGHPEEYDLWKVLTFQFKYRYHVFWTLPLEITYYFIIPVLVVCILLLRKFWLVPLLPLGYWVVYQGLHVNRTNHQPLKPHLPTFVCGSIAAIVYAKAEQWITARSFVFRWWHWLILRTVEMFFLAVLFSVLFHGLFFNWVYHNPVPNWPGEPFVAANVSVVIVCEMLLPGVVASVLEWSLLRHAGKVSFSMYLLHSFVIYSDWVKRQGYWNKFFAIWGLVFLLSTASYYAIEYPCQLLAGRVGVAIKKRDLEEKRRMVPALPVTTNPSLEVA